ncbi:hypothetical protein M5X00_06275 [Paenibacillus alvei]|uniref:Replication protein n=1 Tax=Paenibacillus alvei TaxID=44250 RepID=A0ABT4H8C4_PAEAL|nr:hypothetical protein [Paenibacillus alvei]MCY9542671.1 hypothetical protein [Paenibacillus alvei]MCY9708725.1 hypothetical protein [Paenibacillus alvei]MCY9732267.1 hypothetical protein [Paenibacillus alvei]MCY9753862.1 hypothetical protein [Paenibacillus alvei]MCY9764998.1 hypothetical protein [Paenibacillus alvei]
MYDEELKLTILRLHAYCSQRINHVRGSRYDQYDQLMNEITKIMKATLRKSIKPMNFVKRCNAVISLYNAYEVDFCRVKERMQWVQPYKDELKENIQINKTEENQENELKKNVDIKVDVVKKKRGGARTGAGRKLMGTKKSVTISMPQSEWDEIDSLIQSGEYQSYADYFRTVHTLTKK